MHTTGHPVGARAGTDLSPSKNPLVVYTPNDSDNAYPGNFCRTAKWCPDGTCVLALCENREIQLLKLSSAQPEDSDAPVCIIPEKAFPQPSPILDYAWYPGASFESPATYCFVASVRECPIKLLDASTGRLRASYRIVDHRERQVAPHSMTFNCLSTHLYCGYEDAIQVFDFQTPGEGTKLPTTPSKKSKDGMNGIVSSIAFCPDYSGLYAASSLSGAITLFTETTGEDVIAQLGGISGSIMQVKFNPMHPHLLYASQRRSDSIYCWDVREPFEVIQTYTRKARATNQKLLFDIDPTGRWLITGDEVGSIHAFDLSSEDPTPVLTYQAHDDAVGSVAFHPFQSQVLSVSGSRHFYDPEESSSDDDGSEADAPIQIAYRKRGHTVRDATMKLWTFDDGDRSSTYLGQTSELDSTPTQ